MTHDLSKRVALVTGASRGLGAAIALSLGRCKARVAVNYFGSPDKAHRTVEEIARAGGQAVAVKGDVREEADVARMVAETEQRFGPIDTVVFNATGPQPFVKLEELSWRHCLDQLEFFVKSPVVIARQLVPGMKRRRFGRLIHIGSEVFEKGVPEFSSYVAAKAAQLGLCRSWAMELAPHNVTVNLVAPGWIPTERHDSDPQAAKDAYAAAVPMKRMGVPADIGAAVAFLASDGANFITGQKLSVNGGNSLE